LQDQIATAIGVNAVYKTDGSGDLDTTATGGGAASGGTFWNTPKGYAGFGLAAADVGAVKRGTAYGSGSSVFTQTSTKATA
jgi:hypothetical protein